ncbi:unnamed protein product [Jaminaea pallidilutea]
MARVAEPEILDIPSFAAAAALATRKPWLNALRADIIGVYKIFTQFVRNGEVVDGSYTGEATRQTIASRNHQHAAMFGAASAADLAGQRLNQRQLYNATTLPTRHQLLVTTCHEEAQRIWMMRPLHAIRLSRKQAEAFATDSMASKAVQRLFDTVHNDAAIATRGSKRTAQR